MNKKNILKLRKGEKLIYFENDLEKQIKEKYFFCITKDLNSEIPSLNQKSKIIEFVFYPSKIIISNSLEASLKFNDFDEFDKFHANREFEFGEYIYVSTLESISIYTEQRFKSYSKTAFFLKNKKFLFEKWYSESMIFSTSEITIEDIFLKNIHKRSYSIVLIKYFLLKSIALTKIFLLQPLLSPILFIIDHFKISWTSYRKYKIARNNVIELQKDFQKNKKFIFEESEVKNAEDLISKAVTSEEKFEKLYLEANKTFISILFTIITLTISYFYFQSEIAELKNINLEQSKEIEKHKSENLLNKIEIKELNSMLKNLKDNLHK
ncbi:Hypothetical protein LBF_2134 [Leptospira biflexa serovar Patoc strain 'Patoc 1 (Ames)']|uniref:Uncharacterized protein n=1 Tax=Leptospira biflexa serovar Patoc (strain Patoc 1 / ATCC 23582 / Paris) TaxID=456481 RepID=B0ST54_LEPBP|nr:hypothetical protein [Leptospira biflexa]ABZ94631.1 Hypothetical protein LBF_2134 [Leptospira biflexa serovar Patoc strain 'Patoc 1 (Ames)']ABZ98294.1 Hypothetical protein LEPBI_I2195 [Leptospira biflexa serovar Patoc strain 'Patoc 1 (Paris)']